MTTTTAIDPGRQPYGCVPNLALIPTQLSGRGLTALFAACAVVEPISGEVPGGIWEIAGILDVTYQSAWDAVIDCERFRVLLRKGQVPKVKRLFVATWLLSEDSNRPCEGCGIGLPGSTRGAAKWCAKCRQTIGRAEELHEDHGFVLLWHVPICEPPLVDSLTGDWGEWDDGWFTHFSLLPHAVSENKLQLVKNKKDRA